MTRRRNSDPFALLIECVAMLVFLAIAGPFVIPVMILCTLGKGRKPTRRIY